MAKQHLQSHTYVFDGGPLGYLEGLTISRPSVASKHQQLCHYFGGIPYALPPVGPYRFRRPRPLPRTYRYGTRANPSRFTLQCATCPQPKSMSEPDASLFDENCLQLNVCIPANEQSPPNGWPVLFYIHGGFLQWGSANLTPASVAPLLGETALKAILVVPAYRLNLFGFLSSKEVQAEAEDGASGNFGFWDQRCALEWTASNIGYFGGNANNITVAGYSAGSHSAFHQLAHELYFVPDRHAVIRRVIMWSNSPGVQPRTAAEQQAQFNELLNQLGIPSTLSAGETMTRLRSTSVQDLLGVQDKLKLSEFRATTDDVFVSSNLMLDIQRGDFGCRMQRRGIRLMNGECRDEHNLYQHWRMPEPSYHAVRTRLIADYPATTVDTLLHYYCKGDKSLPAGAQGWQDLFGRIYADMQVHHLERGFHQALELGGLKFGKDVLRYRIDWRAKCMDSVYPLEWEVCHASDLAIWFWGLHYGDGLLDSEKALLRPWNEAFAAFVRGDEPEWQTSHVREMKRLRSDGETDVWADSGWEEGVKVSDLIYGSGDAGWAKSKL